MSPTDFILESINFQPGKIYVVSGPDITKVMDLLYAAAEQIELTGVIVLVYDFKCRPPGDVVGGCKTYLPDGAILPTRLDRISEQSIMWESQSILVQNLTDEGTPTLILIGNEFNPGDPWQNPHPIGLEIDVVRDIVSPWNAREIVHARSRRFSETRELFPYITRLYYYNTVSEDVSLIKEQERYWPETIGTSQNLVIGSPFLGEQYQKGKRLKVVWNSNDFPLGVDMKVELWKGGSKLLDLANKTPDDGLFYWVIPNWVESGIDYAVRVELISDDYSVSALGEEFEIL